MKRIMLCTGSAALMVIFSVYAHSALRMEGPGDKIVQLLTLFPASILFALAFPGVFDRFVGFFRRMPSGAYIGIISGGVLLFTLYMALFPLEGIPKGGDEAAYLFQSRIVARGELTAPSPSVDDPRSLFPFRHFIFRNGEWFVMYTLLHSVLMAPFTAAGISWLLGPLESFMAVIGAWLLFRRITDENTSRLAVFIMAVSPFFLFMGGTHMAHNSNLLFVTWALYFLVRGVQDRSGWLQALSGFMLGLALNTKPYPIMPWTLTITLVLLVKLRSRALPVLLRMAAGAALPAVLFLLSNQRLTGDPLSPPYNLARGGGLMGFGEDRAWFPEYGDHAHTPLRGLKNLLKQAGTASTILLGWPLVSLVPALVGGFRWKKAWPLVISVLMITPFMFVHYAAAIDYGPRHYFTVLPALALLSAGGVAFLSNRWGGRARTLVASLFLVCTALVYLPDGIALRSGPWQAIDSRPLRMAETLAEPPAVVFMEASEHGYPNVMSGFLATDAFLDGEIVFCAHQTTEEDMDRMQDVFSGRNPYLFYFRDGQCHLEPWSAQLSETLVPERALRPAWAPENVYEAGETGL